MNKIKLFLRYRINFLIIFKLENYNINYTEIIIETHMLYYVFSELFFNTR